MNSYSLEHQQFLKNKKKRKFKVLFWRLFIIVIFIVVWEILSRYKIINSFLYSSPSSFLKTIISLSSTGELFKHIGVTIYEVLISFILSVGLGIIISTILWKNKFIYDVVEPYITIINSLPKVAMGPLIILWCGASINSIIFMSLLISLFITIINIYNGFNSVDESYILMLKSFGASKWQIFRYVVFPSNKGNIISTLKVNVSMNLIGVIMGELLVSKKGLGYLIMYGSQVFNIDLVITCIVILGLLSYVMYYVVNKIK